MASTPPESSITPPGHSSLTPLPASIEPPTTQQGHISTILVAVSGPSCSGKTTVARLLRDALAPFAIIVHEDDFYKPDSQIPTKKTSDGRHLQDWDCFESINYAHLEDMLEYVRREGRIKEGFESIEDKNAVGKVSVDQEILNHWGRKLRASMKSDHQIVIIDGFLLFSKEMHRVSSLFDVKLLLRATHSSTKTRREARQGYVTLEGFWHDPPGYVDQVVWPNYVQDHGFLFANGDVEGSLDNDICSKLRICGSPLEASQDVMKCYTWVAETLLEYLETSR